MKKVLVFTATYNEADNITSLVSDVFAALPGCEMLVVDDNSPDGTGRILDELSAGEPRLKAIHRPSKNGLGTAHKLAIKYALIHGYDVLITMDADFSHDPKYLPEMMRRLESAEFVIGSRFVEGGSCEYPLSRRILSRTANTLTRNLLGIPLRETTTSYRGFRRSLMERMNVDAIRSDGYSYFVEFIAQVARLTGESSEQMREFPIRFEDRRAGATKISKKEIWNGFATLARLAVKRAALMGGPPAEPAPVPSVEDLEQGRCNACGSAYQVEEYAATNTGHVSASYKCTSTGHASHGRLVQCLSCGLVFTSPQLAPTEMVSLYAQVEDKTYLENVDARVRTFTVNLDAIRQYLPAGGRLLDVGSYCGIFLKIPASERGYDVTGVEPSLWASAYARDTLGMPTITGTLADVPRDPAFDVICSWDVLEHVPDPLLDLRLVNQRLKTGGVFAFSTLDYKNWFPRLMGERWPWMMDMHLYYFDQKVIGQMLEKTGFRLLHTQSYTHVVTLDYFLSKLEAVNVPAATALRATVQKTAASGSYIPFHFGDIQLFVCEKVAEADSN